VSQPASSYSMHAGIQRLKREADHYSTASTEVKNGCSCISCPPYDVMSCRRTTFPFVV